MAPLKQRLTLPRLELMACLTAAELVKLVRQALHLPEEVLSVCWSDSMIALGWLRGRPERWEVFVRNRVTQIQELTAPESWRHCRSEDNPADLLTRGVFADQLVTSTLWFGGPEWLSGPDVTPVADDDDVTSPDSLPEAVHSAADVGTLTAVRVELETESESERECGIFQVERYGTLSKATRVMAWVLRFVLNARHHSQRRSGELATEELTAARVHLYRAAQLESFSRDPAAEAGEAGTRQLTHPQSDTLHR